MKQRSRDYVADRHVAHVRRQSGTRAVSAAFNFTRKLNLPLLTLAHVYESSNCQSERRISSNFSSESIVSISDRVITVNTAAIAIDWQYARSFSDTSKLPS